MSRPVAGFRTTSAVSLAAFLMLTAGVALSGCSRAPAVVDFRASPEEIEPGASTLLLWVVRDADEVVLTPQIGAVDAIGHLEVAPATSTVYTLTATGASGTASASVLVVVSNGKEPPVSPTAKAPSSSEPAAEAMESELIAAAFGAATQVTYHTAVLPRFKPNGEKVNLENNALAQDPSYSQLTLFIAVDDTNLRPFVPEHYTSIDFAEALHNAAEAFGYRAALAVVTLDSGAVHALNVFNTADVGIVFVDCVGLNSADPMYGDEVCDADTIAYVRAGKPLGWIQVRYADRPDYSFYEGQQQEIVRLRTLHEDFDRLHGQFEELRAGRTQVPEPDYGRLRAMQTEMQYLVAECNSIILTIGACRWNDVGIPVALEVWW